MASPHPPTPSTASPSHHPPCDLTSLFRLVASGVGKEDILIMAKLADASMGKLFDIHQEEGRVAVNELVGSLKNFPEDTLASAIDLVVRISNKGRSEGGRSPSLNPTRPAIDNDAVLATTATPLATPLATRHLAPPFPLMPNMRSPSTGTLSVSSRGSSSTNRSRNNRVTKIASVPKGVVRTASKRKILWCPACPKDMKNNFDNHFLLHVEHELRDNIGEHDSIGCGYCYPHDLLASFGKVYHGKKELVNHVKDNHTSTPHHRLHWDFNASFNHTLIAQEIFRRILVDRIQQESQNNGPPNKSLTLSWTRSQATEQLLQELQVVSGEIDRGQPIYTDAKLYDLLDRVYNTALQGWQHLSAFPGIPQPTAPRLVTPRIYPQPQVPSSLQDIAGMGQDFFDAQTHSYPHSIASPSIVSPSTPAPAPHQQLSYRPQQPPAMNLGSQNNASAHVASAAQHATSQNISFDGFSSFSTATMGSTPPSQVSQQDGSFEELCKTFYTHEELYKL